MKRSNKLGLGTAQWGLPYGVSNQQGITPPETVVKILAEAEQAGITVLDTASLYGGAESVLGENQLQAFQVVTKTPKFGTPSISDEQVSQLDQVFHQSLQKLSSTKTYGLLIHHAEDILVPGGEKLIAAMLALKEKGKVERVGVSVYDSRQVDAVLKTFKPDIIQLPLSILDQRMLLDGRLELLKNEGVEIHVRSVFLQGLLLMPSSKIPNFFDPVRPLLSQWHLAVKAQRMTPIQAALSFIRDIPYVDTVLVGIESLAQLRSCIEDFSIEATFDASGLACNDPMFVNPALWRLQ